MRPGLASPQAVYRRLLGSYGPQGWWPVTPRRGLSPVYRPGRKDALTARERTEVCVGAILTQNTSWANVERALNALHREGLWDLRGLLSLPERRLQSLVRPSGYFRQKAKKLKAFAREASRRGGLDVWLAGPARDLRGELLAVWGVGPETADSILLYAAGRPVFVVDAYTLRIGRRLGWFGSPDYSGAQRFFKDNLPVSTSTYKEFHALLVALAKFHCRSAPLCRGCPLLEVCPHGRKIMAASR